MTVPRGTSAMVSILRTPTEGEVVLLMIPPTQADPRFPAAVDPLPPTRATARSRAAPSAFGEGKYVGRPGGPGRGEVDRLRAVRSTDGSRSIRKMGNGGRIARIVGVKSRRVHDGREAHAEEDLHAHESHGREGDGFTWKHQVTPGFKPTKFPDSALAAPGASDSSDCGLRVSSR